MGSFDCWLYANLKQQFVLIALLSSSFFWFEQVFCKLLFAIPSIASKDQNFVVYCCGCSVPHVCLEIMDNRAMDLCGHTLLKQTQNNVFFFFFFRL